MTASEWILGSLVALQSLALMAVLIAPLIRRKEANAVLVSQMDELLRGERTHLDKWLSKIMALQDPQKYQMYRSASQLGMPEGVGQPPRVNHGQNDVPVADTRERRKSHAFEPDSGGGIPYEDEEP